MLPSPNPSQNHCILPKLGFGPPPKREEKSREEGREGGVDDNRLVFLLIVDPLVIKSSL